jgi:hypothetical protein
VGRGNTTTVPLSDFISETLLEIIVGVEQARKAVDGMDTNAEVCPTGLRFERGRAPAPYRAGRGFVQEVAF